MKKYFNRKILLSVFGAIVLVVGIFYAGFQFAFFQIGNSLNAVRAETSTMADMSSFWDIVSILKKKHIEGNALTDQKIIEGAIKGAISELGDPYTTYMGPSDAQKFNEDLSGVFGGIGAEIGVRNDLLTIIAPLKGNPAEKAGLKAGDKILKIGDAMTADMSVEEAVKIIRGEPGTIVTLLISREGLSAAKEYKVTRAIVNVPTLDWEMKSGGIAYFRIYNFNANLSPAWDRAAAQALLKSPKGVIIDVRNNPGGFLDIATDILEWFVPRGKVLVQEKFGTGENQKIVSNGNGAFANIPVVVIINEGSASASEIVAGALKDLRNAKIIGVKSFGKGSVQEVQTLDNGSMVKISIAEWLTPYGTSINKKGISPTDEVKLTDTDVTKKRDPQLQKAINLLTAEIKKK